MSFARAALAIACTLTLATASAWASPETNCAAAASEAEQAWALPANLLLAIGLAESGERDPATGRLRPAPYSVNVAGTDVAFETVDYAIGAVAALRRRGVSSIDVGCFQINLQYHPDAFASLPEAFDARANARYAGGFLRQLFERTRTWEAAVAAYHSADPARGGPYRDRVFRFWRELAGRPPAQVAPPGDWPIPVYTLATLPPSLRVRLVGLTKP